VRFRPAKDEEPELKESDDVFVRIEDALDVVVSALGKSSSEEYALEGMAAG
jgi:hypothetical protein